ncbi:PIG-L deacetylase family protein [Micromonospora sp. NPDC050397]|uniref:PIG-L deacetylase family protein n=1 Tax=Micromonospora sp. NPDC050397 TaxID=3364279 RepID=UPI00384AA288
MTELPRRQVIAGVAGMAASGLFGAPARTAALPPALFAVAHPDDELLAMGVAIAEHLALAQDVHVLWLSRGTASGARHHINGTTLSSWWGVAHVPADEGYQPLGPDEFGAARIAEGTVAVRCLAAGTTGTLTLHEAGLLDGEITQAQAQAAIVACADQIAPGGPVRLKTHSHVVDNHPDHVAAGRAARALHDGNPGRFGDLRQYILPPYWSDARLDQVSESWDLPTDAAITQRVRNASRAYGAWSPTLGSFAIGWHSVPTFFSALETNPRCMVHT